MIMISDSMNGNVANVVGAQLETSCADAESALRNFMEGLAMAKERINGSASQEETGMAIMELNSMYERLVGSMMGIKDEMEKIDRAADRVRH